MKFSTSTTAAEGAYDGQAIRAADQVVGAAELVDALPCLPGEQAENLSFTILVAGRAARKMDQDDWSLAGWSGCARRIRRREGLAI